KVHISNDNEEKFSKLVLKNDEKEDIKLIRGIISDYWEEQPSNEYTHIIIDSPYLITLRKLKALTTEENIHIIVKAP
ncbi:6448_t:CDS:1, partial [Rhizophagus irregularis]